MSLRNSYRRLRTRAPADGPLPAWGGWLIVIPGVYGIALLTSVLYGTPAKLPGISLGLPVLLHLERAAAMLAALAAVLVVAYLTFLGYLPTQLGNVGYPTAGGRQHELEQQVATLAATVERRLIPLEDSKKRTDAMLQLVFEQLEKLQKPE